MDTATTINTALRRVYRVVAVSASSAWLLTVARTAAAQKFENPLGNVNDITGFLTRVIQWLLSIVGLVAILALVYGGLQMIAALGDESRVRDAKRTIFWAIVGVVVAGLSFAILQTFRRLVGAGV